MISPQFRVRHFLADYCVYTHCPRYKLTTRPSVFFHANYEMRVDKYEWHKDRRKWQIFFSISLGTIFIVSLLILYFSNVDVFKKRFLATIGLATLLLFIFLRATSFHQMDQLINLNLSSIRMNWVLELLGPSLILLDSIRVTNVKD